jgi:hypothetical protein
MLRFRALYEEDWVQLHREMREKTTPWLHSDEKWDRRAVHFQKEKAAAGAGLGPSSGSLASEPRRSLAFRALPLPNSILLAKELGGFSGYFVGVPLRAVSFRAFHRLPAVAKRTPTNRKVGNRSIAFPLNNGQACILCSKPGRRKMPLSPFSSSL